MLSHQCVRASKSFFAMFAVVATLAACGRQQQESTSSLNYLAWSESAVRQSTISKARMESINVCLKGSVSAADLERSKTWARSAILAWLRIAKVMDEKVTSKVVFTCANTHLTINLKNGGGTSFASPSVATIYMTRPYGTWTHEFGHALAGLSDTYASGAGKCQSGQPESLMCWGAYGPRADHANWSTMWPDDIAGFRANYKKVFRDQLTAPEWAGDVNLEGPVDLAMPWPGAEATVVDHMVTVDYAAGATAIDYDVNTTSVDL